MNPTPQIVAGLAFLAVASTALAQPPGPPMGDMKMRHEMGSPPADMEKAMAEHRAQMARDMHVVLRLRPDQEGAWTAYAAALGPPHVMAPEGAPPDRGGEAMTTPERLDRMDKRMAEMDGRREKIAAATRTFYAALSPEQQQVFDALERLRGPRGPGRMMIMLRPPGGPPPPPPGD